MEDLDTVSATRIEDKLDKLENDSAEALRVAHG